MPRAHEVNKNDICSFPRSGSTDDSTDTVPPPGTPGREETVTPSADKGHRLGTRTEASKSEAYDELYEQANTLLKNLHFEWLHRKAHI